MGGEGHHRLKREPDASLLPDPDPETDAEPFRRRSDAAIAAEALRHLDEQQRIAAMRSPMTPQEAQKILQRRGKVVYRASVAGGRDDRWYVTGKGNDVTDAQLIALGEEVASKVARPA